MPTSPRSEEQNPSRAAEDATQAAQDAVRRTSEQSARITEAAADMNNRAVRMGAEIFQRHAETAQQAMQSGATLAARLTERSADQFGRIMGMSGDEAQKAAQKSSGNVDAIVQSSAVLAEVAQHMTNDWMNFAHQHIERNFDHVDALFRARTPQDFAAIHSELIRNNLESFLSYLRRMSEKSMRLADEATKKFGEGAERSRRAA